jgi:hypothetical protein
MKTIIALLLFALPLGAWSATCVVTEHESLAGDPNGRDIPAPAYPPLAIQPVTYTVPAATDDPFSAATRYIGFICDAVAHFQVAAEGDAETGLDATFPWVPANTWLFIIVPAGMEIAFYDGSSS